jgi:anti-sigma regulatory factor (Ser/Thr protein kinase)
MKIDAKVQKSSTDTKIELKMCSNPDYLCVARMAVRQVALSIGLREEDIERIVLAVVEALTNVIRHSYGGPCDKPIILKLSRIDCHEEGKAAIEILIRDFGEKVDPESIKGRDLEEVEPGGVGVHIMKSVMDEVEYTPNEDCGMQLRMVKVYKFG